MAVIAIASAVRRVPVAVGRLPFDIGT
jgi:hypothetical protein